MPQILEPIIHPDERIALFIDGANMHSATRTLPFDVDYKRLLDAFREHGRFIRAYYYTAIVEDQEFSPIRPLVDWLDYNGYTLVTKPAREFQDANGRRRYKGDMDVEIAVDMLAAAEFLDHAFLFSGDGDFTALVAGLQKKGVRVTIVSTVKSNPPMAADELRRQADHFLDLSDLAPVIGRPPKERAPTRTHQDADEEY